MTKSYQSRFSIIVVATLLATLLGLNPPLIVVQAQGQQPLLPVQMNNVSVISNTTVNFTLPGAFILSGTVAGTDGLPIFGGTVTATSGNQSYTGPIAFRGFSSAYQVVLPAGTYSISVTRLVIDLAAPDQTPFSHTITGLTTVQVSANTTRNLMVPVAPPGVNVMGTVTSPGPLPTKGTITFTSTDGKISSFGELSSTYQASLPVAMYQVTIGLLIDFPGDLHESLNIPMGTINVTAAGTFNFRLPAAFNLTGTVKKLDGSAAAGASVLAGNPTALGQTTTLAFGFVAVPNNSTTGAYMLTLPTGNYGVSVGAAIAGTDGQIFFSIPPQMVNLTSNQTRNFTVPAVPPIVTISGTVRNMQGQPVANAGVSASTQMLTNTPNVGFVASTTSKNDGTYQLKVLSGMAYTVRADPPAPIPTPTPAGQDSQKLIKQFLTTLQ